MHNRLFSRAGLLILALVVLLATVFINQLFRNWRLDLTEDHLYTLSDGSAKILENLQHPLTLRLYFSDKSSEGMPQLRSYETEVKELLQEYELKADGKIKLKMIDPEPFSEQEDQATALGLQGVPLGNSGESFYFGLVATPAGETPNYTNSKIIPFFQLNQEKLLEYDISKLIYSAEHPERPKVGLVSGLPVQGGSFNFMGGGASRPWMAISQLDQLYDVQDLGQTFHQIPKDVHLLVLIQPTGLTDAARFAIDQFVLAGGHVLAFVDPQAEVGQGAGADEQKSVLPELFKSWGITMPVGKVVADERYALKVAMGPGQRAVPHLGIQGYGPANLAPDDVVTEGLSDINLASSGVLEPIKGATTIFEPLISSSADSMLMDASKLNNLYNPETLYEGFKPTGQHYVLAARITGPVKTAFPAGAPKQKADKKAAGTGQKNKKDEAPAPILKESKQGVNIIVIADTDILTDRLWVQVGDFFGQQVAQPFASNGDFIINAVDNLLGNANLISIRSRGVYSRPFTRVEQLERQAEARFQAKAEELQQQLQATEASLSQLQVSKDGKELVLTPEQQQSLQHFQQEKLRIRKELRNVQHQLDKNITELGDWLKFINIAGVPILLTVIVLLVRRRRHRLALQ